jgi:hypothetical protein
MGHETRDSTAQPPTFAATPNRPRPAKVPILESGNEKMCGRRNPLVPSGLRLTTLAI